MPFRQKTNAARALTRFSYESAKTILFVYVMLSNSLKVQRHLRARGITGTVREFWKWTCEVGLIRYGMNIRLYRGMRNSKSFSSRCGCLLHGKRCKWKWTRQNSISRTSSYQRVLG